MLGLGYGHQARSLLRKLYGNGVVFMNLPKQARLPFFDRETIERIRDARLMRLVRYAAETVPYYRSLFIKNRIDPRNIKNAGDLARLPLLDKTLVRENPLQFVSDSGTMKSAVRFTSSGSTGEPLTVYHDRYSLLANIAFGERERSVFKKIRGIVFGGKEVVIQYKGSATGQIWDYYRENTFIPVRPDRTLISISDPIPSIVASINAVRPDMISSYGSFLEMFFRTLALEKTTPIHLPKMILYGGDGMTPDSRRLIEEGFGVQVLSTYQAIECFKIGFFCEERNGFHLHEDLCHVRIVDRTGQDVAEGENGEVVISNLVNHGTVLLNYRLGDMASISCRPCPCGRNLYRLHELEGRKEDILHLPNGDLLHPRLIWKVFHARSEILQYQLIQHGTQRFELKLVTADPSGYDKHVGPVLEELGRLLGASARIEAVNCRRIPIPESGKVRPVIALSPGNPGQ
ncbi:MAG: hypothetical protein V1793_05630 [Pseudomonadota bacterium]